MMLQQEAIPQPEYPQDEFTNLGVDINTLPRAKSYVFIPLEKPFLHLILIQRLLFAGLLFIGIIMYLTFSANWLNFSLIGILFGVLLLWISGSLLLGYLGFKKKAYSLREQDIMYRSGLIFRKWIALPFNRVQHCEIKQGPIEDIMEICRLKIYTAGGSGSDMVVPGLRKEMAETLKSFIISKSALDEEE